MENEELKITRFGEAGARLEFGEFVVSVQFHEPKAVAILASGDLSVAPLGREGDQVTVSDLPHLKELESAVSTLNEVV